jgi:hypothetical protein
LITDESALKKPTYTLNGTKMSQNEEFDARARTLLRSGVLGIDEEAEGAVGGFADMKKDGTAAIEDYLMSKYIRRASGGTTHDDGRIKNHIRYFRFVRSPQWAD